MKSQKYKTLAAILGIVCLGWLVVGCSSQPDAEIVSKYTEQTALAIIDGSWKIAGSIVFGLLLHAILSD